MTQYEMLLIIQNDLSDDQKETNLKKVQSIIEKSNGKVVDTDKWGTKKFAYPINYKNEGFYVLMNFEAEKPAIKEISNVLNITDGIVRFMIVAK